MLRVLHPAPGFAGRAPFNLRSAGTRACRDAGTRLTEVKNCVITYFMYGKGAGFEIGTQSSETPFRITKESSFLRQGTLDLANCSSLRPGTGAAMPCRCL